MLSSTKIGKIINYSSVLQQKSSGKIRNLTCFVEHKPPIDRYQLLELSDKEYPYRFDERGFLVFYKPGYIKSYDELGEEYRSYSMYKGNGERQ